MIVWLRDITGKRRLYVVGEVQRGREEPELCSGGVL